MKETKTMKKLMIAAAVAAMTAGAFADACSDPEEISYCRAWDVKMSLKSLCPKKTTCTIAAEDACSDPTKESVYFLENCTRKIKGYLWVCEYECGKEFNVCLWDYKNKIAIIPVAYGEFVEMSDEVLVYGKKANKVAGSIAFEHDNLELTAAGINGKMVRGNGTEDCYVKSLSGYAAGKIAVVQQTVAPSYTKGGLCEDPEPIDPCEDETIKYLALCDACCFEGWCGEEVSDLDGLVPAVGTWSMKYNKKVSKGNKTIASLVPSYAL